MRRDSGMAGSGAGCAPGRSVESGSMRSVGAEAEAWLARLSRLDPSGLDEGEALAAINALERVKRAVSAAQARLSVRVDQVARARQRRAGVPTQRLGVGVAAQIGLARVGSPPRGARGLGVGKGVVAEVPGTPAAVEGGPGGGGEGPP